MPAEFHVSPQQVRRDHPAAACRAGRSAAGHRIRRPSPLLHRGGFTLVELLVVIAIIGGLVALLVPAIGAARAAAQAASCLNNLRELGMATQIYSTAKDQYPVGWDNKTIPGQTRRWMDILKPYLEKKCAVYRCPSDPEKIVCTWDPDIVLSYGINTFNFHGDGACHQPHSCFWYPFVKCSDVPHPSRVVLYADCTPGKYYCGGGSTFKTPVTDVAYRHRGGTFNVAYCDGHAETKTETVQSEWDSTQ